MSQIQVTDLPQAKSSSQAQVTDLRRYISTLAAPGATFDVKVTGGITIADGTWTVVQASQIQTNIKGKVPGWIPGIGGKKFNVTLVVELLDRSKARVSISGSVSGSAVGNLTESGDELKIKDLKFESPLQTITEVSLTRVDDIQTRASFYRIPYTIFWFQSWFVPKGAADSAAGDYPSPPVPEGVQP